MEGDKVVETTDEAREKRELLDSINSVLGKEVKHGLVMGSRDQIAYELLAHFGLVSGRRGPDDSQGRATIELLEPKEVVGRCLALADEFILQSGAKPATIDIWEGHGRFASYIDSIKYDSSIARLRRK